MIIIVVIIIIIIIVIVVVVFVHIMLSCCEISPKLYILEIVHAILYSM